MLAAFRDDEDSITLSKLCSRIEINISTGHRWRLAGKIETFRIGGRHYVSREAWERFIEKCNGGSKPTRPGDEGTRTRTLAQRRRDDARAARACEALGV